MSHHGTSKSTIGITNVEKMQLCEKIILSQVEEGTLKFHCVMMGLYVGF